MSDADTTVTTETADEAETPSKLDRFKTVLKNVAPFAPAVAIAAMAGVGSALILKALKELEDEEDIDVVEGEVIIVEPATD